MKAILSILFLLLSMNANAVILGYITGSDYVKMNSQEKSSWVVGVMDEIMAESFSSKSDSRGPWLGRCVKKHDMQQLKAVFEKELNNNPEGWHVPAAIVYQSTIKNFCNTE
jgi:hypothetical protein